MTYTINKLAKMGGISVRTLHYYDEIGLLIPSYVGENGYRYYKEEELIRLQQILFFRELDFPLLQIKEMLDSPKFDPIQALKDQKKLIELEKERLNKLLQTITNSIQHMKNQTKIQDEELYGGLSKQQIEKYKEEARQKWGSEAVDQSEKRMKNWTKADSDRIAKESDEITKSIVSLMDHGPENAEVQFHIDRYFKYMQNFYDCSYEIFRGLGNLYVEDKRFTAFYDKYHPDLAAFMQKAMAYYADTHEEK